jgi:aspartate/methionine/tyrosine aminotransferase
MSSIPPNLALGLRPFALERFFAQYEFNPNVKHLACCSDSEPLTLAELLQLGDSIPGWRARWGSLSLGYTESAGNPDLRAAVASRHFTSLAPDNIVIAAPQEGVLLAMLALLWAGDAIVCMHPAYQSLYEVASAIGVHVELWRARSTADGNTWFDTNDLRAAVAGRNVKLVVVNAPHNPTGWLPTLQEWENIKNCCAASTYPG